MKTALLFSGGMDSTTLLWSLRERAQEIHAISIDYNQRHKIELQYAAALAQQAGVTHKIIALDLNALGGSPLTDPERAVPRAADGQQIDTVVPFRNMLFATLAAAYAETQGIFDLYLAPVKDDYSAYRDCRRPFYDSLEQSLSLGATREANFKLHTPFVEMWKTEVVALGLQLKVPYAETHTCYEGQRPACGQCDACAERLAAFKQNDTTDPLAYKASIKL